MLPHSRCSPFFAQIGAALITAFIASLPTPVLAQYRTARDLNAYFPFTPVETQSEWTRRRTEIEERLLLAAGLWPMPEKTPLNARIHGRVERDDYTIDRVIFESLPGHYVTGSLYLPKTRKGKIPAILCPHGHWPQGRFMDRGEASQATQKEFETGAETMLSAARSPVQARCVQLARMGCAAFIYDMIGYADSIQFESHRHGIQTAGFCGVAADLNLQTYFGLQTWNSIRAVDFLLSLENVDPERIGCTGASGGATQTLALAGIDPRIKAAFPCVMVSTAMQGGCTCENSHHLRVNQGNVDIAALTAPRPLGLTAADDWTRELETKGLPDLKKLYTLLGAPDHLAAHIAPQFPHNYNLPSRTAMYAFFNRHFQLGLKEPIQERDFVFLSSDEATVWKAPYSRPEAPETGLEHEKKICAWMSSQNDKLIHSLISSTDTGRINKIIGTAWKTMIGRDIPAAADVEWTLLSKKDEGTFHRMEGTLSQARIQETVPVRFWHPKQWDGSVDVLLDQSPDAVELLAQKSLKLGRAAAAPYLYLSSCVQQPRFGDNLKAENRPDDYRQFSAFTYGYNPSLLARRVHDVSALVAMIRGDKSRPVKTVRIVAGSHCTAVALTSGALLKNAVDEVQIPENDFRFEHITSHWDPDFMPGAVKYGDVEGLSKLVSKLVYRP
jgi:dienelactone hydrolase